LFVYWLFIHVIPVFVSSLNHKCRCFEQSSWCYFLYSEYDGGMGKK